MPPAPVPSRAALVAALAGALTATAPAAAADPPLLYLMEGPAAAVHDALGGPTLRQAPASLNPRWPAARTVGKVSGRELAGAGARRIAGRLRAAWRAPGVGGLVAVDEITPAQWSPEAARALGRAMAMLGGDARRVMFYASPALVERVGRRDPRLRLPARLRLLVGAMSRGRATYLLTYRGSLSPFPPREMATHPTRWAARWPAGPGRGELRLLLGPDGGLGQAELWGRVRATPAGRALLSNGPGAYGLRTADDARAWAAQYRAHLASPHASPTGRDARVPGPGSVSLAPAGPRAVRVAIARPGRAVVSMRPRAGGRTRAIARLSGPASAAVRLPRDARPGRYVVRAVLIGDGLRDRAAIVIRLRR